MSSAKDDATTAMVINWHRLPETDSSMDARLRYRMIHPSESEWITAEGESMEFWYRDERVNRVVITNLNPGSVYEFKVREAGERFRFRAMPSSLEERPLKIVMTSDHQSPGWNQFAHDNARMAALQKPDMFIVAGDFVNDEGRITPESANRWVTYLDNLYGIEDGYFFYEDEIDGKLFENLITDTWPWYETHHSDVRQDLWLKNLLEPENGQTAGERYTHIIPVWHRGLFGTVRKNMTYKNRPLLKYWMPILYRNGVKLIKEGHDHTFTRTIPMHISSEQPSNTTIGKISYAPTSWPLPDNLSQKYLDNFFSINSLKDIDTDEIVGWEYDGNFISYNPMGMIAIGHGGWAAGRREPGGRGGGNAGLWFVDPGKGGDAYGGEESFHLTIVHLSADDFTVEALHPDQLENVERGYDPLPLHRFRWDISQENWYLYNFETETWETY